MWLILRQIIYQGVSYSNMLYRMAPLSGGGGKVYGMSVYGMPGIPNVVVPPAKGDSMSPSRPFSHHFSGKLY